MRVCGHELEQVDGHGHVDNKFVEEHEDGLELRRAPFALCSAGAGGGRGFGRVERRTPFAPCGAGAGESRRLWVACVSIAHEAKLGSLLRAQYQSSSAATPSTPLC